LKKSEIILDEEEENMWTPHSPGQNKQAAAKKGTQNKVHKENEIIPMDESIYETQSRSLIPKHCCQLNTFAVRSKTVINLQESKWLRSRK
jgi:hypothetical protein